MLRANRVVQAIETNPLQMWRFLAENVDGGRLETLNGATMVSLPFAHPLFNSVLIADLKMGEESLAFDKAITFFGSRQMPWTWMAGPVSRPDSLRQSLETAGFTLLYEVPGMAVDLQNRSVKCSSDVVEVKDREGLSAWLQMVQRGFGLPEGPEQMFLELHDKVGWQDVPVRYFYAQKDGEPLAFSMVFYGAGVAGIYCVATVPEARRQGYGEKVMNSCLAAAIEDGYDVAILHSSRMGLPLYEKLGFKEYSRIANYAPPRLTLV